ILDRNLSWTGLDDSKQLTAEQREELYARVLNRARAFAWSAAGPRVIDRLNIRRATHRAMASAVRRLSLPPDLGLVDGHGTGAAPPQEQLAVIGGDAGCLSIAAASVVAKVVRDRLMERLDRLWPAYGFARHKGYGTAEHLEALRSLGPCRLHRWSFAPVTTLELPLAY